MSAGCHMVTRLTEGGLSAHRATLSGEMRFANMKRRSLNPADAGMIHVGSIVDCTEISSHSRLSEREWHLEHLPEIASLVVAISTVPQL